MFSIARTIRPSYKNGFAPRNGVPEWDVFHRHLQCAYVPVLGVTGNTLRDVGAGQRHGTLNNMDPATDWVMTEYGPSLVFAGTVADKEKVESDTIAGSVAAGESFTVTCWFTSTEATLVDVANGLVIKGWWNTAYNPQWGMRLAGARMKCGLQSSTFKECGLGYTTVNDGELHLATLVVDQSTATMTQYLDGPNQEGAAATGIDVAAYGTNSSPFTIGLTNPGNYDVYYHQGAIYEVCFFKGIAFNDAMIQHYFDLKPGGIYRRAPRVFGMSQVAAVVGVTPQVIGCGFGGPDYIIGG